MNLYLKKGLSYIKRNIKKGLITLNSQFHFIEFSLPDFLIIGAQKSGTTSLYSYLVQHPGIIAAECKEVNYFGNPHNWFKGKLWYASHFGTKAYKYLMSKKLGYLPITGEASPNMHKPFCPKAVYEALPSVKLIAIFRNPVDRAFSQYQHNCRHGRETLSFEEAIAQSPLKLPPDVANDIWRYYNSTSRSYIRRGLYAEQLQHWYQYYSKERIHIINSDDFFVNPRTELIKVLQFLDIPDFEFDVSRASKHAGNYKATMKDETREYLNSLFRPHNRKLFELIGRDFGWPA